MENIAVGVCFADHTHDRDTNTAVALCVKHGIFLCTSCLIKNSHKNDDCKIIAINAEETELEKLQVNVHRLRQSVTASIDQHENVITKNEEKLSDAKGKLEGFRNKLVKTIDEKRDTILSDMQSHHEKERKNIKGQQTQFENIISSIDKAMTDDSKEDTKLLKQVLDNNLLVFGSLPKPSDLHEHSYEFNTSSDMEKKLNEGNWAACSCVQIYDIPEPPPSPPNRKNTQIPDLSFEMTDETGSEDYGDFKKSNELQNASTESKNDKIDKMKPKQDKSDGKRNDTKPSLFQKIFKKKQYKIKDKKIEERNDENKSMAEEVAKRENRTEEDRKESEAISTKLSDIPKPVLDSYFIIKCHDDEVTPCCFKSIRLINEGKLLIFDTEHQSLMLVDYKGTVMCEKKFAKNLKHITVVNDGEIVAASHDATEVVKFQIKGSDFFESVPNKIGVDGEAVTSFEFDRESQKFALITRNNVVILDNEMAELKRHNLSDIVPSSRDDGPHFIKSFFVFDKEELILFNTNNKSIKCYSLLQKKFVHKIKCNPDSVNFGEVFGLDDSILICCEYVLLEVSKNGDITGKYDIEENMGGCRSVCVDSFEKVMLLTSMSKEKAKANRVYVTSFNTTDDTSM